MQVPGRGTVTGVKKPQSADRVRIEPDLVLVTCESAMFACLMCVLYYERRYRCDESHQGLEGCCAAGLEATVQCTTPQAAMPYRQSGISTNVSPLGL